MDSIKFIVTFVAATLWFLTGFAALDLILGNPTAVNGFIACGIWATLVTALGIWLDVN